VVALVIAFVHGRREPTPQEPTPAPSLARPTSHPFEGVYELRRRVAAGIENLKPGSGFLAITHRHLFVSFAAPGNDPDLPLLRSSTRTWTAKDDVLQMTVQLGWYTEADGTVRVEQPGTVEKRRLEVLRGLVRLCQDDRNYLEFERVE
jgi:hypothetical protein